MFLNSQQTTVLLFVRYELANEIGDFIGGGIECEVTRLKDVNLSLRQIKVVRLGRRSCLTFAVAGAGYPRTIVSVY